MSLRSDHVGTYLFGTVHITPSDALHVAVSVASAAAAVLAATVAAAALRSSSRLQRDDYRLGRHDFQRPVSPFSTLLLLLLLLVRVDAVCFVCIFLLLWMSPCFCWRLQGV